MRLFRNTELPTADLYLRIPLRGYIADTPQHRPQRPITRCGPHLYVGNGRAVLIRYASRYELWRIRSMHLQRCAWLIDDDLWAVKEDTAIPADYRARLARFRSKIVPRILELCDTVIAPNERILQKFPDHERHRLNPSCAHVQDDFSHFTADAQTIDMVFAGTRSHLPDLEAHAEILRQLCETHPNLRLTTFLQGHVPAPLRGHERIINRPPLPWPHYRTVLESERFHIGLALFRNTAFNRARSVNKVLDHAAFGAAGIYTDMPPFNEVVEHEKNGLLVTSPKEAAAAIESLLSAPERMKQLAQRGAKLADSLGNLARNRSFWLQYFGLPET